MSDTDLTVSDFTSSVREVMPVRAIDEKEFVPGPAAAALQAALREHALAY